MTASLFPQQDKDVVGGAGGEPAPPSNDACPAAGAGQAMYGEPASGAADVVVSTPRRGR